MNGFHNGANAILLNQMTPLCNGDAIGIAPNDGIHILVRRRRMLGGIEGALNNIMGFSICIEVYTIHCETLRQDLWEAAVGQVRTRSRLGRLLVWLRIGNEPRVQQQG